MDKRKNMKKFLRTFDTEEEYLAYTASTEYYLNSVARCRQGSLVFYNPEDCGGQGIHRTISGETYCDGYDKRVYLYKQVSYDDGVTWETTATTSALVEKDSEDCGYVPPQPVITYRATSKLIEEDYTGYTASGLHVNSFSGENGQKLTMVNHTFENGVGTITFDNNVITIGAYAFCGCSGLTSIDLPNGIIIIDSGAFWHCTNLASINIPKSVTEVGTYAFSDCGSLPEENNIRYADTCAVTVVDDTLSSYSIKSGTKFICYVAFSGCTNLTSIDIPDSVISISPFAFYNCNDLTTCHIGSGVTYIGSYAFDNCTSLTTINIPNGITEIYKGTFSNCHDLTSIIIPNSVTTIDDEVFDSCSSLTSITIPNSVTSIGVSAFTKCYGLTSISIPSGITNINKHTFWGCSGLTSINIPDSVTSIGNSAFSNCSRLLNATFGSGVTSIGNYIFYNCSSLTSITCNTTIAPSIQTDTFEGVKTNGTLYVPQGSTGYNTWMQNVSNYLGYYNWTKVEQ